MAGIEALQRRTEAHGDAGPPTMQSTRATAVAVEIWAIANRERCGRRVGAHSRRMAPHLRGAQRRDTP